MKKKPVTAIVYDLDGTLIDSRHDLCAAVNVMRGHFGLPPKSESELQKYIGRGVKHLVRCSLECAESQRHEALKVMLSHYHQHLTENTLPYQGVVEILKHFQHKKQFVLTNKLDIETKMIVQQLGLAQYFTEVIGDIEGVPIKPDPYKLLAILDKYSISGQNAVMVGDSAIDIETGARAGITTIFIKGGIGKIEAIKPDITLDHIIDLKDYLI